MASNNSTAKKKQEEKNVKTLREIAGLPANKNCFDCRQKGPTYVNTTIGSFVCVSCSGKLRGLTPPHRVKSISMANFTTEEVEFLKSRGNEFCQKVWLGFYDMSQFSAEVKDDLKFKDFLVAKYESKRWYKDPAAAAREMANQNGFPTQKMTVTTNPVAPQAPVAVSRPVVHHSSPPNQSKPSKMLADIDFFSQPAVATQMSKVPGGNVSQAAAVEPFFADFQNAFSNFGNVPSTTKATSSPMKIATNGHQQQQQQAKSPHVPSEDRYSALKDLDAIFSSQSPGKQITDPTPSPWTQSFSSSQNLETPSAGPWTSNKSPWTNGFSSSPAKNEPVFPSNGQFGFTAFPEPPSQGIWGSPNAAVLQKNGFSASNPFLNGTSSTMTLSSSQSVHFPIKAWPSPPQNASNPFLDGSAGPAVPKTRSYNPFL